MAEILDFTDFAVPVDFKYNNKVYRIPSFNKPQLEKLMRFDRNFLGVNDGEAEESEKLDEGQKAIESNIKFLDMQDKFIAIAVMVKNNVDVFVPTSPEEFTDWPVKVKNRVMQSINEQMSNVHDTEEEEESEKKS